MMTLQKNRTTNRDLKGWVMVRYYKAKHNRQLERKFQKLKDKSLNIEDRKNKKLMKFFGILCTAFAGTIAVIMLILRIITKLSVLMTIAAFVTPIVIVTPIYFCLSNRYPYKNDYHLKCGCVKSITNKIIQKYGIKDDYLISKCFRCSNTVFNNHDVIIYKHNNLLRITNNLFFSQKDIGFYEFDFSEITISYEYENNKRLAILRCDNFEMVFPMKVKPYIVKLYGNEANKM